MTEELSNVRFKRSIFLSYFAGSKRNEKKLGSLFLSELADCIDGLTNGEIFRRVSMLRDLSTSNNRILMLSHFQEGSILRSIFPMLEEIALVDLGEFEAGEEDGIDLKLENIRWSIRRACRALSQKSSVCLIEIDPCCYPKIAAESAMYGIFHRIAIEKNIPKSSYFFDENLNFSPVFVQHLSIKGISEDRKSVDAFEEGLIIGESENFGRLLHGAGFYITCSEFIQRSEEKFASFINVKFKYRDVEWLHDMGMKSILQVANMNSKCTERGKLYSSFQCPPCLLEIHYDSGSTSPPIVLVGRSSFYHPTDSSILTENRQPVHLIQNVSSGASIIATILAAVQVKIPVNLIGIVVLCTHSFSWRKTRDKNMATESDIFSEVPDSHEERLLLKDALSYSQQFQPELYITIATQTSYLTEAFQSFASVLYSTDDSAAELFLKVCRETGERFVRLPFVDIEDDIFLECVLKKQFCGGCREAFNGPIPPYARSELMDFISKNWNLCFITSLCLKDLLKDKKWLHIELNKDMLIKKNDDEIFELHEITGSPTRSLVAFLQESVNRM